MKIHITYCGVFLAIILTCLSANAFQINQLLKSVNKQKSDDKARLLLAVQPDFTADASCVNYENITGEGFGESVKTVKKGGQYRHESGTFIDYFVPGEPAVRYTLKNKKYEPFLGDAENHLWFMSVESPAILAADKSLKFEIVGKETVDFELDGKTEKREQIKIKVTGETTVGGDYDQAVAYFYVAPHLKNLVFKTELAFPKGGRNCTLRNISFDVADGLFTDFEEYRRRQADDALLRVPKAEEISKITFAPLSDGDTAILTRKSLLAMLPHLIPGIEPTYFSDISTQDGTITLKDGTVLKWSAADGDSLFLSDGKRSQLFFVFSEKVEKKLTLPNEEDIAKVSFISGKKWFTRKSLLKILPNLVPDKNGFYLGKVIQRGTLTLKDGTILRWTTAGKDHLVLHDGKKRYLYHVDYRGELMIPKAEDIEEIGVEPSDGNWFTPETLREALPQFVAGGSYKPKMLWQYGYIELKTGVTINWRADGANTLVLFNRGGETYFHIPINSQK